MREESFETYSSPFTWRYGSQEMRDIWSEKNRRLTWRRIWVALAEAQTRFGLVSAEQVADLKSHAAEVDVRRALEIESEIHHDLMAELKTFAEQCPVGGGIIHLGATSADIQDNADVLLMRESLDLILRRLTGLLIILADRIECWADTPCMGFTHLQPAEPTTVGYRLAQYAQDLSIDLEELNRIRGRLYGKGFKGAVGSSASYAELLKDRRGKTWTQGGGQSTTPSSRPAELELRVMNALALRAFPVSTQTYPRKQDWLVLNSLAGMAGSLYRFAFDLRLLQSPPFGEWSEPFGARQVGSSAMPFKRNPINAENIDSLARLVAALPRVAWDNAAHSLLERTLDDSANRRLVLPQAFLAADELLRRAARVLRGLVIREAALTRNLEAYGTFAATERVLMAVVQAGADRQALHEVIREHSMAAWEAVEAGVSNPLKEKLSADKRITKWIEPALVQRLLDARDYVGDAPERAQHMADMIRTKIEDIQ
jgi:adenylosuccinate lyase